ncbi:hypothetical protein JCM15415_19160 [Methanobacterium movens]
MVGNTQLKVIFAIVKVEKASKVLEKAQEARKKGEPFSMEGEK